MHIVMQEPSVPNEVDVYIASAPPPARPMLRTLRAIVISEAPNAAERLSYGMPYYHYHGRLVYFAANKGHIGVYGLAGLGAVSEELRDYFIERGTLRFPYTSDLPTEALHTAVRARVRQNEAEVLRKLADGPEPTLIDKEVKNQRRIDQRSYDPEHLFQGRSQEGD